MFYLYCKVIFSSRSKDYPPFSLSKETEVLLIRKAGNEALETELWILYWKIKDLVSRRGPVPGCCVASQTLNPLHRICIVSEMV